MIMLNKLFALEGQVRFLFEKRTEAYIKYVEGASQKKIVHGAKRPAGLKLRLGAGWPVQNA